MGSHFPEPNTMPQPHTPGIYTSSEISPPPYNGSTQPPFPTASTTPGFSPTLLTPSPAPPFPSAPSLNQSAILGNELVYLGAVIPNPDAPPLSLSKPDSQSNAYRVSDDYLLLKSAKNRLVGWNDGVLTKKLVELNPSRLKVLSDYFYKEEKKTLAEYLPSKTPLNSWFNEVVHGRALGPVLYDAKLVRRAVNGVVNEPLLVELLLNRTNVEMEALKKAYKKEYGYEMVKDVSEELRNFTQSMFKTAMEGKREAPNTPVNYVEVTRQVDTLHKYGVGKDSQFVASMFWNTFITPSDAHIAAVVDEYNKKYTNLRRMIKNTSGVERYVKQGLLYIIDSVKSKRNTVQQGLTGVWRDAKLLDMAMKGIGTKDDQLSYRMVRASWNPQRMRDVKDAYRRRCKKSLEQSIREETSGSFEGILIELIEKEN